MKRLIFVGDIHGELKKLVWTLTIRHEITNANVIIAGDFGVGFSSSNKGIEVLYNKIKSRLENFDITIYVVRGNHDNPIYFDGAHNYPRLIFLEDYKIIEISGKKILPIGGAVSIDQDWRIKKNAFLENHGSKKRLWWENEDVIKLKNFSILPKRVDFIVTHEAPISFEPITIRNDYKNLNSDIWKRILESRKYLEKIKDNVKFNYWIHGHYHKSSSGISGKSLYRGLNIEEIFEVYNV